MSWVTCDIKWLCGGTKEQGTNPERIQANTALMDYAVRTINTFTTITRLVRCYAESVLWPGGSG
jgi:hypothetical protein